MTVLLETSGLTRRYSGLVAVDAVDLTVEEGGIHGIIGPNGAGKTTLFNLLSGVVAPSSGGIRFRGDPIGHLPPERRARLGIGRTFQNIRVFGAMSVLENVLTGLHLRAAGGLGATIVRAPAFRARERAAVVRAREALAIVGLADRAETRTGALSYGDQRRLEIARAVAAEPGLLLLDEPAAGMNPAETERLADIVRGLGASGITVLLVEHDMAFVMALCRHIVVLNFGRKIFAGDPEAVRQEPAVIEAYLGPKVAARLAKAAT